MQEKLFDLGILEDEGRNMFDEIASKLEAESFNITTGLSHEKSKEIEINIADIENILIDLDEAKHQHFDFIKTEAKKLLTVWYEVWQGNIENEAISIAFNDNLLKLLSTLLEASEITNLEILEKHFSQFQTSEIELRKIATDNHTSLPAVLTAFLKDSFKDFTGPDISTYLSELLPVTYYSGLLNNLETKRNTNESIDYRFSWSVKIKVSGKTSDTDFTYFLWSFTQAINSIKNVKVEIVSIKKGSWIVKMKIWFLDLVAKEEVKTVLDKARNSAEAYIEKPSAEVEKLKMEKLKIESERKKIEKEVDSIPNSDDSQKLRDLTIKKLEAEIEAIKINNALKKLEGIDKVSQLARSGIVKVDEIQIDINDLLLLLKTDDDIKVGKSLDDIDGAGKKELPE